MKRTQTYFDLLGKVPSCPTVKVWIRGTLWFLGLLEEEERVVAVLSSKEEETVLLLPYIISTSFSDSKSFCSFVFSALLLLSVVIIGSLSTSIEIALAGDKPKCFVWKLYSLYSHLLVCLNFSYITSNAGLKYYLCRRSFKRMRTFHIFKQNNL